MKIDKNYKSGTQRGSNNYNQVITLLATPEEEIAPQAGKIIEALLNAKDYSLTVGELVGTDGSTESAWEKAGGVTKQTPMDIWTHYRSKLVDAGYITVS
jgi:hypothetical protein|tara:strand:+ start:93 stop:389 length:297 start_codon:yes stop_codon:yes gene_type:complete